MKIKTQLKYIVVLFFLSAICFPIGIRADEGPSAPPCAESYGDPPPAATCGVAQKFFSLDFHVFGDRFVLLRDKEIFYGGAVYSVLTGNVDPRASVVDDTTLPTYKTSYDLLAIDKDYFYASGGVKGLFTSSTTQDEWSQENIVMSPKNPTDFAHHTYDFIVSSDKNPYGLDLESDLSDLPGYAQYPTRSYDNYYAATDRLDCTRDTCFEKIVYSPSGLRGHHIVLAVTRVLYEPSYLEGQLRSEPYNDFLRTGTRPSIDATTVAGTTSIPSQPLSATSTAPASNWWTTFWKGIWDFFFARFR